jgi:hypothetical protein
MNDAVVFEWNQREVKNVRGGLEKPAEAIGLPTVNKTQTHHD